MVDAFPFDAFLGPNLTMGAGSVVLDYTPAEWDRIVQHGILPDGRPAIMPSKDFSGYRSGTLRYRRLSPFRPPKDNELLPSHGSLRIPMADPVPELSPRSPHSYP